MQQICNKFVMDMTDTRMGPEQKCRNCQFMKKEHNQSNSQQLPQNAQSTNTVSDLKKKFSGTNNQIQEKFQGAVRSGVQQKKQEDQIPQEMQVNQKSNQSNMPIRKIESQTISNESPLQTEQNNNKIYLEKQQSNKSNSDEAKQIQQPPKQQFQIETAPIQNKLINNPFLKNDKQQNNQVAFVKPSGSNKNTIENQSPLVQQGSTTESQQSPNQQIIQNVNTFQRTPMPIIGFGTSPIKKISNQLEPESYLEQQMIERPAIQQKKNKRTIQEFSDLN